MALKDKVRKSRMNKLKEELDKENKESFFSSFVLLSWFEFFLIIITSVLILMSVDAYAKDFGKVAQDFEIVEEVAVRAHPAHRDDLLLALVRLLGCLAVGARYQGGLLSIFDRKA